MSKNQGLSEFYDRPPPKILAEVKSLNGTLGELIPEGGEVIFNNEMLVLEEPDLPVLEDEIEEIVYSFATDILPIFQQYDCAGCHAESMEDYTVLMQQRAGAVDDLNNACVNMMWVEPNEPEKSFLLHKIEGTFLDIGALGGNMMPDESGVAPEDADIIRGWIAEGAHP